MGTKVIFHVQENKRHGSYKFRSGSFQGNLETSQWGPLRYISIGSISFDDDRVFIDVKGGQCLDREEIELATISCIFFWHNMVEGIGGDCD